jgi:uncharacterized membrane protein YphA (DoxX/SURF4 family)
MTVNLVNMKTFIDRYIFIAAVIIGLVLIISGTGKIPGQTEFAWALAKTFWTPALANFISKFLPWLELCLGVMLLLGTFAKIAAILVIPLTICFTLNNVWALNHHIYKFTTCSSCFGIWENYIGHLTPIGAMLIDVFLMVLALTVIFCSSLKCFELRPWFIQSKFLKA